MSKYSVIILTKVIYEVKFNIYYTMKLKGSILQQIGGMKE